MPFQNVILEVCFSIFFFLERMEVHCISIMYISEIIGLYVCASGTNGLMLFQVAGAVCKVIGKPWSVPWTAETIIQVTLSLYPFMWACVFITLHLPQNRLFISSKLYHWNCIVVLLFDIYCIDCFINVLHSMVPVFINFPLLFQYPSCWTWNISYWPLLYKCTLKCFYYSLLYQANSQ